MITKYRVYSLGLCKYLIDHGFELIGAKPQEDGQRVVFYFNYSEEILNAVSEYIDKKTGYEKGD